MIKKLTASFLLFLISSSVFSDEPNTQIRLETATKVSFPSQGLNLSALLFKPNDFTEGDKKPAIVFIRPASGVKEQTAGLYAKLLSDRGFITLSYDPRTFGESEGTERGVENPFAISEDAINAITYLSSRPDVDTDNIFVAGVCMGAWYGAHTIAMDPRVKALAMISPIVNARNYFLELTEGNFRDSEFFQALGQVRAAEASIGTPVMMPVVPTSGPESETPTAQEVAGYYLNQDLEEKGYADHSNWVNEWAVKSNQYYLGFNPRSTMKLLKGVPVFMALGTNNNGSYPYAKRFFDKLRKPKELMEVPGKHYDLYWNPEYTLPISDGVAQFFKKQVKVK